MLIQLKEHMVLQKFINQQIESQQEKQEQLEKLIKVKTETEVKLKEEKAAH